LNNSVNNPSGAGNVSNLNPPGTNSSGTANSTGGAGNNGGAGATTGRADNRAGGTANGRIDGTVTPGPAMPGDAAIREEDAQNSKVDKKIKSICRGC
jgi:hypothetical protein